MLMLRELRKSKGMTVPKLSEISGVPIRTIEEMERRGESRISTARKIADALGVTLDEIYPAE